MKDLSQKGDSQRFAVALSGGVDSAMAAALLKEQGHEVIGLTMLLKEGDDGAEAAAVARALAIPFQILDFRSRFKEIVIDPFAESYRRGETPLPCALCNRFLKFGALRQAAQEAGATSLATGHYVRKIEGQGGAALYVGASAAQDQSYFLFDLRQEQIDFLRFPLGDFSKAQTRALAQERGLPVAEKKASQDICFVADGAYAALVQALRPETVRAGEIVDLEGRVLGRHEGIVHFTIGQRRGLNIGDRKGDHNEPLFVLRLDAEKAQVVVGPRAALSRRRVDLRELNWLGQNVPEEGLPVCARLRSAQLPAPARLFLREDQAWLELDAPAYGVAPGQAGVIYDEAGRLWGGGWIAGAS